MGESTGPCSETGLPRSKRSTATAWNVSEASLRDCREGAGCAELEDIEFDLEDARALLAEPLHAPPLLGRVLYRRHARPCRRRLQYRVADRGRRRFRGRMQAHRWTTRTNTTSMRLRVPTTADCGSRPRAACCFRSADGGSSWLALDSPYHGSWFGISATSGADTLLVIWPARQDFPQSGRRRQLAVGNE